MPRVVIISYFTRSAKNIAHCEVWFGEICLFQQSDNGIIEIVIWCLVHTSFLQRITGCTTVLNFPIYSLCMTMYKMVKHTVFIPVA